MEEPPARGSQPSLSRDVIEKPTLFKLTELGLSATECYSMGSLRSTTSFHPHDTEIGYDMFDAAKSEPIIQYFVVSFVVTPSIVNGHRDVLAMSNSGDGPRIFCCIL